MEKEYLDYNGLNQLSISFSNYFNCIFIIYIIVNNYEIKEIRKYFNRLKTYFINKFNLEKEKMNI